MSDIFTATIHTDNNDWTNEIVRVTDSDGALLDQLDIDMADCYDADHRDLTVADDVFRARLLSRASHQLSDMGWWLAAEWSGDTVTVER